MSTMMFNLSLEYVLRSTQGIKVGLELIITTQILEYAGDLDLVGDSRDAVITNMVFLL